MTDIRLLVSAAKSLADDHLNGPESDLAKTTLDRLEEHADSLAGFDSVSLATMLGKFVTGEKDTARTMYLEAGESSYARRRRESHALSADVVRDRLNRERSWGDMKRTLNEIGSGLLRIMPFLIMAA